MARKAEQGKAEEESRARQQKEKTPVREEEKMPACHGRGHHVVEQAKALVDEQLQTGHIRPSLSPWNTPIFVIKKKSGKWRLLHDLRAINNQMQIMGPVQRGLPLLSALPAQWPIIVVDIKDCFFSIPLHEKDSQRFAFTLPSINHEEPDKRFEWVVPQGMANSPTMCQLYEDTALFAAASTFSNYKMYTLHG
ncbi:hypothetical protein STEG23_035687 [Scotinomys teguina]